MSRLRWRNRRRGVCSRPALREMHCKCSLPFCAGSHALHLEMQSHSAEESQQQPLLRSVTPCDVVFERERGRLQTFISDQSETRRDEAWTRTRALCCGMAPDEEGLFVQRRRRGCGAGATIALRSCSVGAPAYCINERAVESRNVIGLPTGNKLPVCTYLLINPVSTSVLQVGFERGPRRH